MITPKMISSGSLPTKEYDRNYELMQHNAALTSFHSTPSDILFLGALIQENLEINRMF